MTGNLFTYAPEEHVRHYFDGWITSGELASRLEAQQVRGSIRDGKFTGYDYRNQRWIVVQE